MKNNRFSNNPAADLLDEMNSEIADVPTWIKFVTGIVAFATFLVVTVINLVLKAIPFIIAAFVALLIAKKFDTETD